MSSMSGSTRQIRVRFVTSFDEFRITDAPFAVPDKLGRKGLGDVVNHLLEAEEARSFDFAINEVLVRMPLHKFMQTYRLSTEEITTVEYFPAASLSDESEQADAPSWVGALDVCAGVVAAGCYDGQIKLFTADLQDIGSLQAHQDPVRAVLAWEGEARYLASASKDQTVNIWRDTSKKGKPQFTLAATLGGHVNSVESLGRSTGLDSSTPSEWLYSGDWTGNVFIWDLTSIYGESSSGQGGGSKKRRGDKGAVAVGAVKPLHVIKAHSQSVSGICTSLSTQFGAKVLTCSWDHSLKQWDMARQDCVSTLVCSKAFTSIDCQMTSAGLTPVISSHPDGKVRLWDLREMSGESSNSAKATFGKAGQWVSQVRWLPDSSTLFAASSYAGVVSLWDVRSSVPLARSEVHGGKALCLHCLGGEGGEGATVLSGGSDCLLKATAVSTAGTQEENDE
ncbi:WD40-repeat-containing domain protein [Ochromonadaceae sp. CCMP2298]|nr:WD40-repeat-containing domain protein [Ochromonadaceae sp. CCMP2298]